VHAIVGVVSRGVGRERVGALLLQGVFNTFDVGNEKFAFPRKTSFIFPH
jgi:hypothetical protein